MSTNAETPMVAVDDFEAFYVRTGRHMLTVAYSFTGNWGDAEDLVQNAYVAAYRRWHVVGTYDDPAAWVRRVLTNAAVSRWRGLGRELDVRRRLAARSGPATADDAPDDERFWAALRSLPRQQMAVAVLHYVDDQSIESIAAALGCTAGTVKTQLFRARQRLAVLLGTDEEGTEDV
jgi:RNA polymerase sigma-70 factor (ECF subfamily)